MDAKEKAGIVYDRLMEHWGLPDWNTLHSQRGCRRSVVNAMQIFKGACRQA